MDLLPGCNMTIEDKPAPADRDRVGRELGEHTRSFLRNPEWQRLGVFIRDAAGETVATLAGHTDADWLCVEQLWVRADLRRRGLGQKLLAAAEPRARERCCDSAWLDTFSFQAPEFYPKFGCRESGRLDYPPGHRRIFFQRQLKPGFAR